MKPPPLPNYAGCADRPRSLRRLFRTGVLTLLCAQVVPAALFVSAGATGSPGAGGSSTDFGDPSVLSAFANSGGSAGVSPSPLTPSDAQFPHTTGRAEARTNGTLKAAGGTVVSAVNGGGTGRAQIMDTILFLGAPTLNIYIDGSLSVSGQLGDADVQFSIISPGDGGVEDSDFLWFGYHAHEDDSGSYYEVSDHTGNTDIVFGSVPNPFVHTITLPIPPGLTVPMTLVFSLTARGSCQTSEGCFGYASFDNSAHIGIVGDYVSSNGYTYAGFTETPSDVPEPGAGMLAGAGLVVLMIRRLSRSRMACPSIQSNRWQGTQPRVPRPSGI